MQERPFDKALGRSTERERPGRLEEERVAMRVKIPLPESHIHWLRAVVVARLVLYKAIDA